MSLPDSGARTEFSTGAVRDASVGKGLPSRIPPVALRGLAKRFEDGEIKYPDVDGRPNWVRGIPLSRFFDSAFRHLLAAAEGDTTECHKSAILWNISAWMWTEEEIAAGRLPATLDDLPFKRVAPHLQIDPETARALYEAPFRREYDRLAALAEQPAPTAEAFDYMWENRPTGFVNVLDPTPARYTCVDGVYGRVTGPIGAGTTTADWQAHVRAVNPNTCTIGDWTFEAPELPEGYDRWVLHEPGWTCSEPRMICWADPSSQTVESGGEPYAWSFFHASEVPDWRWLEAIPKGEIRVGDRIMIEDVSGVGEPWTDEGVVTKIENDRFMSGTRCATIDNASVYNLNASTIRTTLLP